MAKKKNVTPEVDEVEMQAKARLSNIKAFNDQNAGKYRIDSARVPTEEDVANAQKEYEDFVKGFQGKNDYLIADKDNALRVAKFLRKWLDTAFWTQRFFVGVINFADLLDKKIEEFEKEPIDFVLEYGPMQFSYLLLENYAGTGLTSAKEMALMYDEYVPIFETLHAHVTWYNKQVEWSKELQQKWSMFQAGYYYEILISQEDAQAETDNA